MRRHNEGGCMGFEIPQCLLETDTTIGTGGKKTFVEQVIEAMLRRKNKGLNKGLNFYIKKVERKGKLKPKIYIRET